jgi:hypothetical protein
MRNAGRARDLKTAFNGVARQPSGDQPTRIVRLHIAVDGVSARLTHIKLEGTARLDFDTARSVNSGELAGRGRRNDDVSVSSPNDGPSAEPGPPRWMWRCTFAGRSGGTLGDSLSSTSNRTFFFRIRLSVRTPWAVDVDRCFRLRGAEIARPRCQQDRATQHRELRDRGDRRSGNGYANRWRGSTPGLRRDGRLTGRAAARGGTACGVADMFPD